MVNFQTILNVALFKPLLIELAVIIITIHSTAAIIAIGEWCQRYMPGRTPELTDLVLLAAGAFLLHCVEPV